MDHRLRTEVQPQRVKDIDALPFFDVRMEPTPSLPLLI